MKIRITNLLFGAMLCLIASASMAGDGGTPGLLFTPDAEVTAFEASSDGAITSVKWTTGAEMGVNAYKVTRANIYGVEETVGLVRARLGDENSYKVEDPTSLVGDQVTYNLFIYSLDEEIQIGQWEGEIEVAIEEPEPVVMAAEVVSEPESIPVSQRKCWIGNVDRVKVWTNAAAADRIRFSLTEEGIYKVTAQEIADAGGWEYDAVTNALATTNFAMSCQGTNIAWHPLDDGLIFYGVEPQSRWAPENVYWIEFGPGQNMAQIDGTPPENGTTNQWFMDTMFVQGTNSITRVYAYHTLANEPVSFLAFAPGLFSSGKSSTESFLLNDPATNLWAGGVTVNLISMYDALDPAQDAQTNEVRVGGTTLGRSSWNGEKSVFFSYPLVSTNLVNGVANIEVSNVATVPFLVSDHTHFYWVSCQILYPRLYQAMNGALRCTGGVGDVARISGFTSNDVVVLDITDERQVSIFYDYTSRYDIDVMDWSISFGCGGTNKTYHIASRGEGLRKPSIRGVENVEFADAENSTDYVILIPPEGWTVDFRPSMQELAKYRMEQGLKTDVVDVEDLYNEFSYGLVEPQAIKDFCAVSYANWSDHQLKYLLFAGDGTVDLKHERFSVDDYTACLIPTILGGQGFSGGEAGIAALDSLYGDVDGDGAPEISVGRIPTTSSNDLRIVLDKIYEYEGILLRSDGSNAKRYAAVAPDWNNVPGTSSYYLFGAGVDRFLSDLTDADRVHVSCRSNPDYPNDLNSVKINSLLPALNKGVGFFHFFGHSNSRALGSSKSYNGKVGSKLFNNYDIDSENWEKPTVSIFIGCNNNPWNWIHTVNELTTTGLFAENTGFVAGMGSTGYLLTDEGEELGCHLYKEASRQGLLRIGDVHKMAIRECILSPLNPYRLPLPERNQYLERIHCFSLVGDPALIFRHDITAMGTDVAWLVDYGQTNANDDVKDVDGDGWATWREYQDDTNPTGNTLQVLGAGMDTNSGSPVIAFESNATNSYQVEYKAALATGDWEAVSWSVDGNDWSPAGTNIAPSGPVMSVILPSSTIATQGFFRVRTVN